MSFGARALYLGPAFNLSAHRNAVAVLALCLGGDLELAEDPARPEGGWIRGRSLLIEPGELHLLRAPGGDCAFLYLDPSSRELEPLRQRFRRRGPRAGFDFDQEAALVAALTELARSADARPSASLRLDAILGFERAAADPRVDAAASALLAAPGSAPGATAMSASVGLSPSRFQHLFRQATGVAYRRFRIWARLRAALARSFAGATLTEAALDAGFASAAHFSSSFRAMFGMSPTQLLAARPRYVDWPAAGPGRDAEAAGD